MPAVVSVLVGRVAVTGLDLVAIMCDCLKIVENRPKAELLWTRPPELLNYFQAEEVRCHIITVTHDVLKKLSLVRKDLNVYSLEIVEPFCSETKAAGYEIPLPHSDLMRIASRWRWLGTRAAAHASLMI